MEKQQTVVSARGGGRTACESGSFPSECRIRPGDVRVVADVRIGQEGCPMTLVKAGLVRPCGASRLGQRGFS
jgi:hypothetical protein